jgi:hypothetical protein
VKADNRSLKFQMAGTCTSEENTAEQAFYLGRISAASAELRRSLSVFLALKQG